MLMLTVARINNRQAGGFGNLIRSARVLIAHYNAVNFIRAQGLYRVYQTLALYGASRSAAKSHGVTA